ncbi:MAG: HAD-IIA family hydrolase [Promethearchaeia archaeon]
MTQLIEELRNIKVAIFDLDGVVYRGLEIIKGVDKVIGELKETGVHVIYNSNNSTITRQMYVKKLKKMNIKCEFSDFYTSASITSAEITNIKKEANIFVIGEIGLREELKALGHKIITDETRYNEVDFVIAGLDRNFNYDNLAKAQRCILDGNAQFYATNPDTTLPAPGRLLPGAGVMVNAIETCTGKKPIKIFGKPQPDGIQLILKNYNINPEEACIFGDRLDTDILAGNRAGITTVAVLTGVVDSAKIEELRKTKNMDKDLLPDLTIEKMEAIFLN